MIYLNLTKRRNFMYTTEHFEKEVRIDEYLKNYVNVEEFIQYCRECPNYGNVWSCPPYDFDPFI